MQSSTIDGYAYETEVAGPALEGALGDFVTRRRRIHSSRAGVSTNPPGMTSSKSNNALCTKGMFLFLRKNSAKQGTTNQTKANLIESRAHNPKTCVCHAAIPD